MLGSQIFRRQVKQLLNDLDTGLFDTSDTLINDPFYHCPFFHPLLTDNADMETEAETDKMKKEGRERDKEKEKEKEQDEQDKDKDKEKEKEKEKQLTAASSSSSSSLTKWGEVPISVKLDVIQKDNEYQVVAELPGMNKEDVKLSVKDDILTISGEKTNEQKIEKNNYKRIERSFGKFSRSIRLPRDVDHSKINASQEHGVLTITLPRIPSPANQQLIQIK